MAGLPAPRPADTIAVVHLRDSHARPSVQRARSAQRATPSPTDQLLELQRQVGNEAFSLLVSN